MTTARSGRKTQLVQETKPVHVHGVWCSHKSQIWFCSKHTDRDHHTDTSVKGDCEQAFLPGFPGASIESLSYHPIFLMESWSCSSLAVFFLNSLLNQFSCANLSYFVCCDLGGLTQEAWLTTSGLTRNGGEKPVRWSSHQHSYIC